MLLNREIISVSIIKTSYFAEKCGSSHLDRRMNDILVLCWDPTRPTRLPPETQGQQLLKGPGGSRGPVWKVKKTTESWYRLFLSLFYLFGLLYSLHTKWMEITVQPNVKLAQLFHFWLALTVYSIRREPHLLGSDIPPVYASNRALNSRNNVKPVYYYFLAGKTGNFCHVWRGHTAVAVDSIMYIQC